MRGRVREGRRAEGIGSAFSYAAYPGVLELGKKPAYATFV
jgi:hypothetical protein